MVTVADSKWLSSPADPPEVRQFSAWHLINRTIHDYSAPFTILPGGCSAPAPYACPSTEPIRKAQPPAPLACSTPHFYRVHEQHSPHSWQDVSGGDMISALLSHHLENRVDVAKALLSCTRRRTASLALPASPPSPPSRQMQGLHGHSASKPLQDKVRAFYVLPNSDAKAHYAPPFPAVCGSRSSTAESASCPPFLLRLTDAMGRFEAPAPSLFVPIRALFADHRNLRRLARPRAIRTRPSYPPNTAALSSIGAENAGAQRADATELGTLWPATPQN